MDDDSHKQVLLFMEHPDEYMVVRRPNPVGWPRGKRHTEATRRKISATMKGRARSDIERAAISAGRKRNGAAKVRKLEAAVRERDAEIERLRGKLGVRAGGYGDWQYQEG